MNHWLDTRVDRAIQRAYDKYARGTLYYESGGIRTAIIAIKRPPDQVDESFGSNRKRTEQTAFVMSRATWDKIRQVAVDKEEPFKDGSLLVEIVNGEKIHWRPDYPCKSISVSSYGEAIRLEATRIQ